MPPCCELNYFEVTFHRAGREPFIGKERRPHAEFNSGTLAEIVLLVIINYWQPCNHYRITGNHVNMFIPRVGNKLIFLVRSLIFGYSR